MPEYNAGDRLVVVANRLPVRRVIVDDAPEWRTSPGGLVSALSPALRTRGGSWIGWSGAAGEAIAPFGHDGMDMRPIALDEEELEGYYRGFSNRTCWPLYHDAIRFPTFHRRWWRPYIKVNARFAEEAVSVARDGDLIWVHDYHLQLVPAMIRERAPGSRIGFFLHIPFPPEELFAKMPWRTQVLEGLLGSDVVGFQTAHSAENFINAACSLTDARAADGGLELNRRRIDVRVFPVSIDYDDIQRLVAKPEVHRRAEQLKADLGNRRIILGVDRMDYTKGIEMRLRAIEEVFGRGEFALDDIVFVQVAVPTRELVDDYIDLRDTVERLVGRINGSHSVAGKQAVHYIYRSLNSEDLYAHYLAADIMLVTPYRDGMNLVAKEYAAARIDGLGSLVLSEFAGASIELEHAWKVNPHDVDGMATVIEDALRESPDDAARRMRAMRSVVKDSNVHHWCDSFLGAVARSRHQTEPGELVSHEEVKLASAPEPQGHLRAETERVAHERVLLIATDFDGTIAPIVNDPGSAAPLGAALETLRELARQRRTYVAIVSGRSSEDLASLLGPSDDFILVGSHGAEMPGEEESLMTSARRSLLKRIDHELSAIAAGLPGSRLERKPLSMAFHDREADDEDAATAHYQIRSTLGQTPGITMKKGKRVVELCVVDANKGEAIRTLRRRLGATAVVYLGDDVTDEDVFSVLEPSDLSVKVGLGRSDAAHRVSDPYEASRVLEHLAAHRTPWLEANAPRPLDAMAMVTNRRTHAILDDRGGVVWLCVPQQDDPPIFDSLLGSHGDGLFRVEPVGRAEPDGSGYDGSSMAYCTRWGDCEVLDELCFDPETRYHELRRVLKSDTATEWEITFAPRMDFGRGAVALTHDDCGVTLRSSTVELHMASPGVRWSTAQTGGRNHLVGRLTGAAGERITLAMKWMDDGLDLLEPEHRSDAKDARAFWSEAAEKLVVPRALTEPVRTAIVRGGLTLVGLTHPGHGSIAAAATTSVPEAFGGDRNWDYRYCWPRDSAMACETLLRLGRVPETDAFLVWLDRIIKGHAGSMIQPMYRLDGSSPPPEEEVESITGYDDSPPVRVGNGASSQAQLDVFGPILSMMRRRAMHPGYDPRRHEGMLNAMIALIKSRWAAPDHGIWEVRGPPRHYVYSKVMCWMAVDRALQLLAIGGRHDAELATIGDQIRDDVLQHGFNPEIGAFTAWYGSRMLDAACLWIGLSGLLDPMDPRFLGTIDVINERLRVGPTVFRYRFDDGLTGREGGFHICTSWLIRSMARVGRTAEARQLFDGFFGCVPASGLMTEQYDPHLGLAAGNLPQAYSQLSLIEAALDLADRGVFPTSNEDDRQNAGTAQGVQL